MTSLDTVARAFREHPDFPWQAIQRFYPEDFEGAFGALTAVAGNPHYGYKNELGAVSSTKYSSLAWACRKLLVAMGTALSRSTRDLRRTHAIRLLLKLWLRVI